MYGGRPLFHTVAKAGKHTGHGLQIKGQVGQIKQRIAIKQVQRRCLWQGVTHLLNLPTLIRPWLIVGQ